MNINEIYVKREYLILPKVMKLNGQVKLGLKFSA